MEVQVRGYFILLVCVLIFLWNNEYVYADEFTGTEIDYNANETGHIQLDGLNDAWNNGPYKLTLKAELEAEIDDIRIYIFAGGNMQLICRYELNGNVEIFTTQIVLGDELHHLYEGENRWFIIATDVNGKYYNYEFMTRIDYTPPVISTDIFGDFGYEVLFDLRKNITVWAEDFESGMASLKINPSNYQNTFVDSIITPQVIDGDFKLVYLYPDGDEYGYVLQAVDKAGNISTRIIITRYNVTSKLRRIIPRGNYD